MRTDRSPFAGRSPAPVSAAFSSAGFDMSSLRVLVFEDNARDCALIRKFLEAAGVRTSNIHHADTIPSALQVLRREPVDLVLADYYLQPHTGLDLIDETRHSEFDLPFIVMSALDDAAIDQQALAHGARFGPARSDAVRSWGALQVRIFPSQSYRGLAGG